MNEILAKLGDGFWKNKYLINQDQTSSSILNNLKKTGRIKALDPNHKDNNHHIFWDSDVAKYLEGLCINYQINSDPYNKKIIDDIITKIISNQEDDGYLNSYFSKYESDYKFTNLRDMHELYCAGHLLEAALEHFEIDSDSNLYNALEKYINLIIKKFGTSKNQINGYPGHQEIEISLLKAYEKTSNIKYLELAKYFLNERGKKPSYFKIESDLRISNGFSDEFLDYPKDIQDYMNQLFKDEDYTYWQAHDQPINQVSAEGHSVRALYMYKAMAHLARVSKDNTLFKSCKKLWNDIVHKKMYVHGGLGSTHLGERFTFEYDLPNDIAYAETCASIGLIYFADEMFNYEINGDYIDVIENTLYNLILSSTSVNGKTFFYENYLECIPKFLKYQNRRAGIRSENHDVSCCPPNIFRFISKINRLIYKNIDNDIYINQFITSSFNFNIGDDTINIEQISDFPWNSNSSIKIKTNNKIKFSIFIRIPSWDDDLSININNKICQYKKKNGFFEINRNWTNNEEIKLKFNFQIRLVRSNLNVRYNISKVCVYRGPLLYCMEEIDNQGPLSKYFINGVNDYKLIKNDKLFPDSYKIELKGLKAISKTNKLYHSDSVEYVNENLNLIPYFLWANRGENEMKVWINEIINI
ncbi:MAG: glycoside hydrolase family 127 protein [bacterium]